MTYEEAKKHLNLIQKGFVSVIEFGTVEEAIKHYKNFKEIEIILKALEKQIPKKAIPVISKSGNVTCHCCPYCNYELDVEYCDPEFCSRCGQALDWSE